MTKVEKITTKNKRSYDIKVTTDKSLIGPFYIPVIDVRDGEKTRQIVEYMLKESKRNQQSKYFKPSFGSGGGSYNVSRKNDDN